MKRIMVIYGTRPEAIKVAPLIKGLEGHSSFEVLVAVTGQHREMLDQVNDLFGIVPKHDLDLMQAGATLAELSSRALAAVAPVLEAERPDAVIVQGDTSTAFIAGLAAFYQRIPVVHLEAGLRTWSLSSPFPEEGNRQLLGRIADLHLAPTSTSRANLESEGVAADNIAVTGNTVIDALFETIAVPVSLRDEHARGVVESSDPYVLVTAHRRESWGDPMQEAMTAVGEAALANPDVRWLVPMHRNPVVREVVRGALGHLPQVALCEPLDYHEFCHAMKGARFVLTDSGGVQEEAPSLGKPVIVMRDNTERPEAVDAGTVRLVGTDKSDVGMWLNRLLNDESIYDEMANAVNPYGDGRATERSIAALEDFFKIGSRLPDFGHGVKGTE
ncbi:UDP-N-acetylglucosamine 2-epimerase (non-hydrolyzing) [Nocardioides sp. S5]|uniref:non-hydrolyzing UDP-N-acetylglucosamine 2-epimerase n=1 Tax=Nocardioides sp. S5 TaxID=2017486 RepID=UPI001A8C0F23|nr:UDP-N-acetylglucosamine 2-epimerase (non-hydrolyzing) [Nocardioides sp. S5]QSR32855.1 UDP-N-acetylglucosamine 2-epimerase (non-hydrolyzing) [Nocardioides sp. S5]